MDIIDSVELGVIDGFDIRVHLEPDTDNKPYGMECYSEADLQAWGNDEWSYVGTVVTASKAGIALGEASLWGSEYGSMPDIQEWVSPLNGEGDAFINGYGPGLIAEAIAEAKTKLEELMK